MRGCVTYTLTTPGLLPRTFVDATRQVLKALLMEPRFLSMTPDTGLVDLTAEETSQSVRTLAR